VQMSSQPHSHIVAPPQLTRLLRWLLGQLPETGDQLPTWLPELVANCTAVSENSPAVVSGHGSRCGFLSRSLFGLAICLS
jgi:hypothetical protein